MAKYTSYFILIMSYFTVTKYPMHGSIWLLWKIKESSTHINKKVLHYLIYQISTQSMLGKNTNQCLMNNARLLQKNLHRWREALKRKNPLREISGNSAGGVLRDRRQDTRGESNGVMVLQNGDGEMFDVGLPLGGQLEKLHSSPLHSIHQHCNTKHSDQVKGQQDSNTHSNHFLTLMKTVESILFVGFNVHGLSKYCCFLAT